jgi:hypothetical protein
MKTKDNKKAEWLTVITLSIIIATLNILHVIIGLAETPTGFTYLATGHYYLDYFEYLQHIATGLAGRWMPTNYFTTDPSPADWRFFPYVLLGKIAWIFHLSPVAIYWIAVFFLTALTLIGFYYVINLMLPGKTFSLKIIAFLISIFSGPAYQVFINNGQLILNPYDFWYGPAAFIRRFEVVPYHALGLVLLLFIILVINKVWRTLSDISGKTMLVKGFLVGVLLVILMTFSPLSLSSLLPALLIISTIYFIKFKKNRLKIFLFNTVILILIIPVVLILRHSTGYGGFGFEVNWMNHDPWWYVLLNIGPIILFFPFGLRDYLKENNFLRQMLLIFSLVSYGLFVSPLAYYLETHNLRFFSSISYICFGVLTVFGIKKISSLFKKYDKMVITLISLLLIFYSCFLTFYSLDKRLLGLDPGTPNTIWTYLPSPIIEGLQLLHNYPQANVLTGPYGEIGMFVPIFSYRRAYIGHPTGTPNIEKKRAVTYLFYSGIMTENEANKFLKTNKIGFVILTSLDNFDINIINHYSFLKPIFVKQSIIIWKVTN